MFKLFILKLLPNYYYILYLFINFTYSWNEQDETKRIAQIKEEEKRIFEFQTGQKLSLNNNNNNAQNLFKENYIPPSEYFSSQNLLNKKQNSFIKLNESFHKEININWCFYCASPLNILTEQMQRVIKNLLSVRRAQFPSSESIIKDCINPINLNLLPRQICQGYSHCQTLILTDHNAGNSFVLRGCAERFGAVDPEVLMKRKDNSCLNLGGKYLLHDQVDIQECICEKRKYCYSGTERSWTNKYIEIEKWKVFLLILKNYLLFFTDCFRYLNHECVI
ncbi:hypothetical protein Mgra_00000492 [Meloidogyne graminicola]|uniref:Uncharacterized protein n=1 Tax=Meloidogyne graminicola TaxID=189291 RepID=A0A8T0A410_9BILA|nr:hypothetical protein Mgra_00000492 [Meloidogyne graminicola]